MPMPTEVNFTIYDGFSETHRFSVTDAAGNPRSLTGYTSRCQVRDTYGGVLLLDLTEGSGVVTNSSGYVDVTFDGAVIGPAAWTQGVYDLWLVRTSDSKPFAIATGAVQVAESVAQLS